MPDSWRDRWDGPGWRWWTLAAAATLALGTICLGVIAALVLPGGWSSLALSGLLVELFVVGAVGSGMLEGLASRAIAGGMARQPLQEPPRGAQQPAANDLARRERRTIRAGITALPLLAAFVTLLLL